VIGEPSSQLAWPDPPWRISGRTLTAWFEIDRELLERAVPDALRRPATEPSWARLRFYDARFESLADADTHPLVPRSGTFREAVIAFPARAAGSDGDATMFMWADSEAYTTWGREVFGWPVLRGRIDLDGSLWDADLAAGATGSAAASMAAGSAAMVDVTLGDRRDGGRAGGYWVTPRRTLLRAGLDGERHELVAARPRLLDPGAAYDCRATVRLDLEPAHPLHGLDITAGDVFLVDGFSMVVGEQVDVHPGTRAAR
jgi:hypothetical protein